MPRICPCGKRPSFNVLGQKRPICCAKCKTDEMIDVVSKKCPCGKNSTYNLPGEKPIYCVKCKTSEMVNVKSKKCPCGKQSNFNVLGETTGVACAKCKSDEMIDVRHKKCLCGKIPNFNIPEKKTPICCSKCKTDEMIDVVAKRCPCGKRPSFNVSGKAVGVCCAKCKTSEMIDVVNKRCPCGRKPNFNVPEETSGVCCSKCKTNDMIDILHKMCPGYGKPCPVRTRVSRGHDYCMSCDPNDARRKQYKRYEEAFFDYVKDELDIHKREFTVSFDPNETSKKFARLDGVVFGDSIVVCLEVDEDGHENYDCDEHRMHLVTAELLQKYPDHVVSWVRVNPTVDAKSQWSKKSKAIREKRFDDVICAVNDILRSRETKVVYIGFD